MKKLLTILIGILGFILLVAYFVFLNLEPPMGAKKVEQTIEEKYLANENIKGRYNFDNGKLITKIEHIDDIKIAVGEVDFKPNMEISRWDGEIKMKVKPRLNSKSKIKDLKLEDKKIKYKEDKKEYHLYEVKKGDETYNGATSTMDAYEVEVILLEKPDSNIVEMDIETQGLNFYHQPPLNLENNPEADYCTETHCYKDDIVITHRPENVIGSYAVYHESETGDYSKMGLKNYRAGKAFHIYRPRMVDSAGKEVWGKLNITDNLLTVEIPQEFLDNAVYPVRHAAGLEFGITSVGGTEAGFYSKFVNYIKGTTGVAGTLDSISTYIKTTNEFTSFAVALYSNSSGHPNSKLAESSSNVIAGITADWYTNSNITYSLVASTIYWVAYLTSSDFYYYYDTDAGNREYESITSFPTTATPTTSSRKLSTYGTYTAGGGAARRIIITQ